MYVHVRLEFKEFLECFVPMRLRLVFLLAHNFKKYDEFGLN